MVRYSVLSACAAHVMSQHGSLKYPVPRCADLHFVYATLQDSHTMQYNPKHVMRCHAVRCDATWGGAMECVVIGCDGTPCDAVLHVQCTHVSKHGDGDDTGCACIHACIRICMHTLRCTWDVCRPVGWSHQALRLNCTASAHWRTWKDRSGRLQLEAPVAPHWGSLLGHDASEPATCPASESASLRPTSEPGQSGASLGRPCQRPTEREHTSTRIRAYRHQSTLERLSSPFVCKGIGIGNAHVHVLPVPMNRA